MSDRQTRACRQQEGAQMACAVSSLGPRGPWRQPDASSLAPLPCPACPRTILVSSRRSWLQARGPKACERVWRCNPKLPVGFRPFHSPRRICLRALSGIPLLSCLAVQPPLAANVIITLCQLALDPCASPPEPSFHSAHPHTQSRHATRDTHTRPSPWQPPKKTESHDT